MYFFDENEQTPKAPSNPNIRAEPIRDVSVDTKYIPRRMLLTHIEGFKWVVEYYSQFLGQDTELAPLQLGRPEVYQQYLRIKSFEMRVQSPLQQAQDSSNKEFTYTGSAAVFPGITPNKGDMFVADIGDGRLGLFTVTEVEQKSILRDTSYVIEYGLKDYLTEVYRNELNSKTVKEVTFVKDFYLYGKNPLLVNSEKENYDNVKQYLSDFSEMFYGLFYSTEYSTLLRPSDTETTYDPYIAEFVMKLVSVDVHSRYRNVRSLNWDRGDVHQHATVLDALLPKKPSILTYAHKHYELARTSSFPGHPLLGTLRYSGVARCVKAFTQSETVMPITDLPDEVEITTLDPVYEQGSFDTYLFSPAFYQRVYGSMSQLELLTYRYLNDKPIVLPDLLRLCGQVTTLNLIDKFYTIPILLLLLNDVVREIN